MTLKSKACSKLSFENLLTFFPLVAEGRWNVCPESLGERKYQETSLTGNKRTGCDGGGGLLIHSNTTPFLKHHSSSLILCWRFSRTP